MSRRNADQDEAVEIPKHELTAPQLATIDLLVKGKSEQEAADAVQVTRTALAKWRKHDVWFVAELNRRRQGAWATCADRLRAMLPKALDVLESELNGGNPLPAAMQVFRLSGLDKIGPPTGVTNADVEIDRLAKARRPDPFAFADGGPVSDHERAAVLAELNRQLEDSDGNGLAGG